MIKKIAILGIIVLFTLLLIYCTTDDSTILGPFGNSGKYISVANFSADKTLLYSNGDTAYVSIKVLDVNRAPAIGLIVDFTTQFGNITESDTTDSSGIALATFISDDNAGENIITADTGVKKYELYLHVVHYKPKYVELFAESLVLLADGISSTIITAVFKDSAGNPMSDLLVTFSTNLGSLYPIVTQADGNGMATTKLTSSLLEGIATVTAISSVAQSIDIKFQNHVPAFIELSTAFPRLWADGESFTTITAVVKDSVGSPMSDMTVNFITSLGTLSRQIELTNSDGMATTELTSALVEGVATVMATSYISDSISVEFNPYVPSVIELSASSTSILADGLSAATITATAKDKDGQSMSGLNIIFSTTQGMLSDSTIRTDQTGLAEVTLISVGRSTDTPAIIKAVASADTSISEDINIELRGITSITNIDSAKMSDYGIYKAYIRTNLFETTSGANISGGTVSFSSPTGTMKDSLVQINEQGIAFSVFKAEVLSTEQNNNIIISELSSSSAVSSESEVFDIPGAEVRINVIDDDVMGDGVGWALVKATLKESEGNRAIPSTGISWSTTLGTIKGKSLTNSTGQSIETLRIEQAVNKNIVATVTAHYGNNVSANALLKFIAPVSDNRIILGYAPDTTGQGFIPCDIDTVEIGTKDMGITALLVDGSSNPIGGEQINFQITPNDLASICRSATTIGDENGRATVMVAYPIQHAGEIVRIWAVTQTLVNEARGSIDVILPAIGAEDDEGGG